jgi:benzil reductase ((S)-benzoin forming)
LILFIITGVSRGLGLSVLKTLLEQNNEEIAIIGLSRTRPDVNKDVFTWLESDLSDYEKVVRPLAEAVRHFEASKVFFINNAADVYPLGLVGDLEENEIYHSVLINIVSPVLITNWLISHFGDTTAIKILNISSGAATREIVTWSQYCSSKAYMKMFFDVVQAEAMAADKKITVVNINPGVMDTVMQQQIRESNIDSEQNRRLTDLYHTGQLKNSRVVAQEIFADHILSYL